MKSIFKYEFKKFFFSKKNKVMFCIIFISLFCFLSFNINLDHKYVDDRASQLEEITKYADKKVKSISIVVNNVKGEEKNKLKREYDYWRKVSNSSLLLQYDYSFGNHQTYDSVKNEHNWNVVILEGKEQGYNMDAISLSSKEAINEKIMSLDFIIKNKIDIPSSPYVCTFLNLSNLLFDGYIGLAVLLIFLFLIFDMFSVEFEMGGYKILYSNRYSRKKILISKFISSLIILLIYIITIFIVFGISGFVYGFGDPTYPYTIVPEIDSLSNAVILMWITFVGAAICLIALTQFLSYWSYSSSVTIVTLIAIFMVIIIFQQIIDFRTTYTYIPFCFIFCKEIIQNHGVFVTSVISTIFTVFNILFSISVLNNRDLTL